MTVSTSSAAVIIFFYSLYFMWMEFSQLLKLGFMDYFGSFWNVVELVGHAATLVISPCVLCRYGLNEGGFIQPLVSSCLFGMPEHTSVIYTLLRLITHPALDPLIPAPELVALHCIRPRWRSFCCG